jgi:cell division GTPase FtsZ
MPINLKAPQLKELKPRIVVCGVGGAGGNAINNMIVSGLSGVDFVVANTDAQALGRSRAQRIIQMGLQVDRGSRRRLQVRDRQGGGRGVSIGVELCPSIGVQD